MMEKKKRNRSHAPQVPLTQRRYEAEKHQLIALGLPPKELEQRLRTLATKYGL